MRIRQMGFSSRQGQWLKKHPMVAAAQEAELDERDLQRLQSKVEQIELLLLECKEILGVENEG